MLMMPVEGIVLLRRGENPDPVLKAIREKVNELNSGQLPPGVKIVPYSSTAPTSSTSPLTRCSRTSSKGYCWSCSCCS